MRLTNKKMNKIFGLAYSGTSETELKTGAGVARIHIDTRDANGDATLDADQLSILLELNGDAIIPNMTGTEINLFRLFDKQVVKDGVYVIDFWDFKAVSIQGEQEGTLLTNGTDNLVLKVTAGAKKADQPDLPSLKVSVKYVDVVGANGQRAVRTAATPIRVFRRKTLTTNTTGEIEWPIKDGMPVVKRVAFKGNVTDLSVKISGKDNLDKMSAQEIAEEQEDFGRVPQAGWLMFDPGITGRKTVDRLDAAKLDLEINPYAGAAGSISVLMENFETSRGI
ncbi:MAG: major capsid protein P2 [Pontibacterium sp.]